MAEQVVLDERLDTAAAGALATRFLSGPADGDWMIDGSKVAHFGAQAVQVVLSAARSVHAAGGTISCEHMSERAVGHLSAMGLTAAELVEKPE